MAYLGHKPAVGENNSFRILDDISSYVLTFDGSSASVIGLSDETITITENNHRFITGQRVTYSNGGGGNITGLTNGQAYFVINHSKTQIKLASSASNALAGTAVNLTGLGTGSSHTLTLAFDGVNTKFDPTFGDGMHDTLIKRAAQLVISLNGIIQQPHDTATPSTGFGVDSVGNIIFSTPPASTDIFWGHILASNTVTFDSSDNDVDTFTGNGSTTSFTLSKIPPDNRNILVTIDGVVQYPSDAANTRSYSVSENVMTFVAAPGNGTIIQVRHIGYAGSSGGGGGGVTGFYGRTGNVSLQSTDNIVANDATFNGNVSIAQTLTYEDVTNIDSVGLITARSGIKDSTLTAGRIVFVDSDKTLTDSVNLTFNSDSVRVGDNASYTAGTGSDDLVIGATTGQHGMTILTGNNSSSINFADSASTNPGAITYQHNGSNYMRFRVAGGEKVRILQNKVGIGTTNPDQFLHILDTSGGNRIMNIEGTATSGAFLAFLDANTTDDGSCRIGTKGGNKLSLRGDEIHFETGVGTSRAFIDSNGKFGIGDFSSGSVSQALHVKGSAPEIYLEHTGGYDMTLTTSDGMGMNGITVNGGFLSLAYNNKNIVMCRTGGSVGIGTVSPTDRFHVYHATENLVARFESGDAGGGIVLKDNTHATTLLSNNGAFEINVDNGNDLSSGESIAFKISGSEKLSINTGGDITATSTSAGATGPTLKLFHNSASPAANDVVSRISMVGDDAGGNETEYGRIETVIDTTTNSQETAHMNFSPIGYSVTNTVFRIKRRGSASAPSYTADDADGIILDVYNTGNPYRRYMNFIAKASGNTESNIGFWTEEVDGDPTEKLRIHSGGLIETRARTAGVRRMILAGSPSNTSFNIEAHDGATGTSSGDIQGELGLYYNDGTTLTDTATIKFERGSGAADGAMTIFTDNKERLRIASNGNIQLGSANDAGNSLRYFDVYNLNTGSSAGSILRFITRKSDGSSSVSADIVKYKTGGLVINNNEVLGTTGFISFGTGTAGGSVTEKLRIKGDGIVCIDNTTGAIVIGDNSAPGITTAANGNTKMYFRSGNASQTSDTTDMIQMSLYDQNSKRGGTESSGSWKSKIQFLAAQMNGGVREGAFIQQDIKYNNFSGGSTKMRADLVFATRGDAETSANDPASEKLRIGHGGEVLINGDGTGSAYLRIKKDRDTAYNSSGGNDQDLIIQQISDATNTQGYSSLALQCNYTGQTGAWVALNAVRTDVGAADLTINPRNNSTGDVEKARFTSGGDLKFANTQDVLISNTYTNGSLTIGGNVGTGAYAVVKGASVARIENYITTGSATWLERFTVNQHGTVLQPTRHGDSIETKPGARYYVINGATPLDGDYDDNTYTPLFRCGHSWNGILTLWMSFNGTEFQNGARQQVYHAQGVYGYPSNSLKTQHNQNALGTGLGSLELGYQNTSPGGGLPNYYLKVRGTWTSGNNQPYVLWSWAGFNSAYPYAL